MCCYPTNHSKPFSVPAFTYFPVLSLPDLLPCHHPRQMLRTSITKLSCVPCWSLPSLCLCHVHLEDSSSPFRVLWWTRRIGLKAHSGTLASNKHGNTTLYYTNSLLHCFVQLGWNFVRQRLHLIHLCFPVSLYYFNKCQLN